MARPEECMFALTQEVTELVEKLDELFRVHFDIGWFGKVFAIASCIWGHRRTSFLDSTSYSPFRSCV